MTGEKRRSLILAELDKADAPISATTLANKFSVMNKKNTFFS